MNFHSDEYIMEQVNRHYQESLTHFDESRIVGIFCQGSPNYGLDYENSDIDTKLIITPTFKDIVFNKKPISTTHILDNEEHVDWKDIRLYMGTFVKQNLNFLEILFTDYKIINPVYAPYWNKLIKDNEKIAHMNPYRAVKSMKGIAMEKYHAMEHEYPSKINVLKKHGYDGKQVHHLLRVEDYLIRYINNEPYENCLKPSESIIDKLMAYKRQEIPLSEARIEAKRSINNIISIADSFCSSHQDVINLEAQNILNEVQYNIIKISMTNEFIRDEVYD